MTHGLDEHCSDEELLLEYYGESSESAAHLSACAECGARFRELKTLLSGVTLEPPERSERYGLEVWQAIRPRLPVRQQKWHGLLTPQWGLAAAAALLLAVGFTAGRMWPQAEQPAASPSAGATVAVAATDDEARRRVVLLDMRMPTVDGWEFSRRYRAGTHQPGPAGMVSPAARHDDGSPRRRRERSSVPGSRPI